MEMVLYTLRFNWFDFLFLMIPLAFSIAFFTESSRVKKAADNSKAKSRRIKSIVLKVTSLLCLLIFLFSMGGTIIEYIRCQKLFREGNVSEVIGSVENYIPMPATGHSYESFTISDIGFSYSNYVITVGYHSAASLGGVVTHDGQHLKIKYIDHSLGQDTNKIIVYISEIPD